MKRRSTPTARAKKKPRFIEFNPQFTFDNFIVGNSNRFANAAAVAVAEKAGRFL